MWTASSWASERVPPAQPAGAPSVRCVEVSRRCRQISNAGASLNTGKATQPSLAKRAENMSKGPEDYFLRNSAYLCIAAVFLVVFIGINGRLFTSPVYEDGDFAANALQIQNAAHFSEFHDRLPVTTRSILPLDIYSVK